MAFKSGAIPLYHSLVTTLISYYSGETFGWIMMVSVFMPRLLLCLLLSLGIERIGEPGDEAMYMYA